MAAAGTVDVAHKSIVNMMPEELFSSVLFCYTSYFVLLLVVLLILHLLFKFLQPYIIAWFLNRFAPKYNKMMESFKQELLKDLETLREKPTEQEEAIVNGQTTPVLTVVEIGVGSGANFKYYPEGTAVVGIEPNPNFAGYLEKNVALYLPRVRLQRTVVAYAEDLRGHVEDCSVDAVVCTLVLCSVKDVDKVLGEVKRVLKPGGKFYFLEHVAANPGTWILTFQWLVRPVWAYIGDGCQILRTPWVNIDRAGFANVSYKKFLAHPKLFSLIRPHVMGFATK